MRSRHPALMPAFTPAFSCALTLWLTCGRGGTTAPGGDDPIGGGRGGVASGGGATGAPPGSGRREPTTGRARCRRRGGRRVLGEETSLSSGALPCPGHAARPGGVRKLRVQLHVQRGANLGGVPERLLLLQRRQPSAHRRGHHQVQPRRRVRVLPERCGLRWPRRHPGREHRGRVPAISRHRSIRRRDQAIDDRRGPLHGHDVQQPQRPGGSQQRHDLLQRSRAGTGKPASRGGVGGLSGRSGRRGERHRELQLEWNRALPDEKKLYILEADTWDLDPLGVPSNPGPIAPSGDGLAGDSAGNLYASGTIYNAQGQRIGAYPSGTNLTFGGADGRTLFIVGTGTPVQEVQMNLPGLP